MPNPNNYTTETLINNIEIISHLPIGNNTFSQSKILTLATREMQTALMKQIISTRGGYYKTYLDYDLQEDGLYVIPGDAISGALDNVELVQEPTIIPVNLIEESEQFSTISPTSTSYGFFMKGNYVQILPTPQIGVARLWFLKRTADLVLTTQCAPITSVTDDAYTVSYIPSSFAVGSLVDVVGDQPPFNIIGESVITDITGNVITIEDTFEGATASDWIALHNQTCVPQIPVEYRVLLEQRTAIKIMKIQGVNKSRIDYAMMDLKQLEADTINLITPRVKSQSKIIMAVNGGFLAGSSNKRSNFPAGRSG